MTLPVIIQGCQQQTITKECSIRAGITAAVPRVEADLGPGISSLTWSAVLADHWVTRAPVVH